MDTATVTVDRNTQKRLDSLSDEVLAAEMKKRNAEKAKAEHEAAMAKGREEIVALLSDPANAKNPIVKVLVDKLASYTRMQKIKAHKGLPRGRKSAKNVAA